MARGVELEHPGGARESHGQDFVLEDLPGWGDESGEALGVGCEAYLIEALRQVHLPEVPAACKGVEEGLHFGEGQACRLQELVHPPVVHHQPLRPVRLRHKEGGGQHLRVLIPGDFLREARSHQRLHLLHELRAVVL